MTGIGTIAWGLHIEGIQAAGHLRNTDPVRRKFSVQGLFIFSDSGPIYPGIFVRQTTLSICGVRGNISKARRLLTR